MNDLSLELKQRYILLLILFIGASLRLIMFAGFIGGDDIAYISRAFALSQGDFSAPLTHWGTRTLPMLLTTFSITIFGLSDFSIVFFPLLTSIVGVFIGYLLGKQLFDMQTGLLAALLVAIFPLEILFATQLFPFVFLSVFTALCLYLFVRGEQEESDSLLFFSGIALGLAYTSRITALYCLLFFGLYLLWKRQFKLRYVYFILGLLLVSFAELAYYYLLTDDALHRFDVLANQQFPSGVRTKSLNVSGHSDGISLKWFLEPFIRPVFEQEIGFTFLILWPIILYQIFKRNVAVALLLLWIIPLFLYINYGSTSPVRYFPLRRLPRYLSIISIPIMVLIACHLRQVGYRWRNSLIVIIAASSVLSLLLDNSANVMSREKLVVDYIHAHPSDTFYIAKKTYFNTQFYEQFKPNERLILLHHKKTKPFFISNVEPNIKWVNTTQCGDLIIAQTNELDSNFKNIDYKILKTFEWELNLYQYVKNHEYFLQIIALFRDDKRLNKMSKDSFNGIALVETQCRNN